MSDKLLKEVYYLDASAMDKLTGPVIKALGHFGKTVTAGAKLIGNDVGTIIKWNVRFTLNSLEKQEELMRDWKQTRQTHLKTIYENQNAALESLGPDKYTCMLMCPGLFWSSAARRGTSQLLSGETMSMIGEFGADKLPIIGGFFAASGDRGYKQSFFDKFLDKDTSMAGDGTHQAQVWNRMVDEMGETIGMNTAALEGLRVQLKDQQGQGKSFIKGLLHSINKIFLLDFSHHERQGGVLIEGDDEKKIENSLEFAEEMMEKAVKENMKDAYSEERQAYIQNYKETFEPGISATEKIMKMNLALATEDDPDAFFKIIQDQAQKEPEFKELNPEKLREEFDKMVKKLASDEKVMTQLRKDLEKSGELKDLQEGEEGSPFELTEKEKPIFEEKLKKIAMDNVKGGFLQTLKDGMIDLYEKMMTRVNDGLEEETMEDILKFKDPIATEYIEAIQEFQKRLEDTVSSLR